MREITPQAKKTAAPYGQAIQITLRRIKQRILTFHRDERGLSTVEALLLIAVAAIILIGLLRVFFPELFDQVRGKIQELFSTSVG